MKSPTTSEERFEFLKGMLEAHAYVLVTLMAANPPVRDWVRSIDQDRLEGALLTSRSSEQHLAGFLAALQGLQKGSPT